MLAEFQLVWSALGEIFGSLPTEIVTVASFIFVGVGIIGVLRSF